MNRTARIYLRVSPEEKRQIAMAAAKDGHVIAKYLREVFLTRKVQTHPSINPLHWARLAGALSNLNQAIRVCNVLMKAKAPPSQYPDIVPLILDVRAKVEDIRHDLKIQRRDQA